jgi:hypothetical protein
MREIHIPRGAVHGWRDFLVHIGTIAVGLLLALALEQAVLAVHHHLQREEIEQQMQAVLNWDLQLNQGNFRQLDGFRAYHSELKAAITSRLRGGSPLPQPPLSDARSSSFLRYPNLAPYEVAKQNGTVGLLPTMRLRQYARLALARDYMLADRVSFTAALAELESFQKRYVDYRGSSPLGATTTSPQLESLTPAELAEYRTILGQVIAQTDTLYARLDLIDQEIKALLAGARTEEELLDASLRARPRGFGVPAEPPFDSPGNGADTVNTTAR